MKIAFFSNFLNHHQLPLCQAFLAKAEVEFVFVATEPIAKERLTMGYEDMNAYPFVLRAYESEAEAKKAVYIAETYDVVIFGATPLTYLQKRMDKNLLSFRFCERSLKKGTWRRFIPRTRRKIHEGYIRYKNKKLYVLGASAYTAHDLILCGFDKAKCFKWGYFPEIKDRDVKALLKKKEQNQKTEILYAGRLLKLKRVIDSLKAIRLLVKQGTKNIHFTVIGEGEEKARLQAYVEKHDLGEYVSFLPFMSPEDVRTYMDKADVYIFGSNFYEGWGAVVNEAMNSACALLVSHAVGSAAYLIKNGENGFIYPCGNVKELAKKLRMVVEDPALRHRLGEGAYRTVKGLWSAQTAADCLLTLSESIEHTPESPWEDGPGSSAENIKNDWIKKK